MSWSVSTGFDRGDPVISTINEDFRDPRARADLRTRVSIRFLGNYMLQTQEHRDAFEDSLEPFLKANDASLVAGITRTQPVSYTYHIYCRSQAPNPDHVPIPEFLRNTSSVTVHNDPEWVEYTSWLPKRLTGFGRFAGLFHARVFVIRAKLRKPRRR